MFKKSIFVLLMIGGSTVAHAQTKTSLGATTNQNNVGIVLTTPIGAPDAATATVISATTIADPAFRSAALAQLTPQAYTLVPEVSLNAVEAQETNILRYVRDLRGNAERPDGSEVALDDAGRVGLFVTGGARFGKYKAAVDRPAVKNDNYMAMGGLNFRLSAKSTIGAFGGYMKTDVDFQPSPISAPSKLNSWFAGGFGTLGVGPVYIDAWGSYTDLNWSLQRGYDFAGQSGSSRGKTDGHIWAAGAATGLSFSAGNFEIEPFGAIRYAKVKVNGFSESGSPGALTIGRNDAESLRLNLGGRIGTKFDAGNVVVRPQLRGGWNKEFELDDPRTLSAAFNASAIGTPFTFTTTPLKGEYYNAGAALNIAGSGPLSMVVDYDVQFAKDREFHALSVGARLKF
jgi:outer membrane autotransporter protein